MHASFLHLHRRMSRKIATTQQRRVVGDGAGRPHSALAASGLKHARLHHCGADVDDAVEAQPLGGSDGANGGGAAALLTSLSVWERRGEVSGLGLQCKAATPLQAQGSSMPHHTPGGSGCSTAEPPGRSTAGGAQEHTRARVSTLAAGEQSLWRPMPHPTPHPTPHPPTHTPLTLGREAKGLTALAALGEGAGELHCFVMALASAPAAVLWWWAGAGDACRRSGRSGARVKAAGELTGGSDDKGCPHYHQTKLTCGSLALALCSRHGLSLCQRLAHAGTAASRGSLRQCLAHCLF